MTVQEFVAKHPEVLYVSVAYVAKTFPEVETDKMLVGTWEARLVLDSFDMFPTYPKVGIVDVGSYTGDTPEEAMDALFKAYDSK